MGYYFDDASPVYMDEEDLRSWVLIRAPSPAPLRLILRRLRVEDVLGLDFGGKLRGSLDRADELEPSETLSYAFSPTEDVMAFSELLALSLTAGLNLSEEEHIALLNACRNYYSNADAGGPIAISSMLPERGKQLELLKVKLEELTIIPPSFSPPQVSGRAYVDLSRIPGRYAKRALAFAMSAKFCLSHQGSVVAMGSAQEMLPEGQTKSMRYPLEAAAALVGALKEAGARMVIQTERAPPKEIDEQFGDRLEECLGRFRMKRRFDDWRDVCLMAELGGTLQAVTRPKKPTGNLDVECQKLVLSTLGQYSRVTYAGLLSFLRAEMEEARVGTTLDGLIQDGYVEVRKGGKGEPHLHLTEGGRALLSSLEGEGR